MEIFSGLNICGCSPMKFLQKYSHGSLARSAYYLRSIIKEVLIFCYLFYNELCVPLWYIAAFIGFMNIKPSGEELCRSLQRINNINDPYAVSVIIKGRL